MFLSITLPAQSLEFFVKHALENNDSVLEQKILFKAQQNEVKRAWLGFAPTLSLQHTHSRIDENSAASMGFEIPAEFGFDLPETETSTHKTALNVQMSVNAQMAANARLQGYNLNLNEIAYYTTAASIVIEIADLYFNVYELNNRQNLLIQIIERLEKVQQRNKRLFEMGHITDVEYRSSQIELNSKKIELSSNGNDIKTLSLKLKNRTGLSVENIEHPLAIETLATLSPKEKDIEQSPVYLMEKERTNIAQATHKASYGSLLPNATLSYGFGYQENATIDPLDGESGWNLRLIFTWPLINLPNKFGIRSAKFQKEAQFYSLNSTLKEVSENYISTISLIESLTQQLELAQANSLIAKENFAVSQRRFELGEIDNTILMQQITNFLETQSLVISLKRNLAVAVMRHYHQTGNFSAILDILNAQEFKL